MNTMKSAIFLSGVYVGIAYVYAIQWIGGSA